MNTKLRYSHFILSIIFIFSMSSTSYAALSGDDNAAQLIDDLASAIEGCKVGVAKRLINSSPNLVNRSLIRHNRIAKTRTMLDLAIDVKSEEIVEYLLEKGATLTTTGVTTLHKAAASGNKRITEIIFNHGKDLLNAQEPEKGHTPLQYAALYDVYNRAVMEYLIDKGAELYPTLLHDVIKYINDCESIIDEILKRKSELLNAQDYDGCTPFMQAVKSNKRRAMKHLLKKDRLDLTKKDTIHTATALAWAIHYNRPIDIIISILDKNSQLLNERSGGEKSLLHEAINMNMEGNESDENQLNREAIIKELLRCKPDLISLQDGKKKTPLQYAKGLPIRDKATICALLETAEKTALQPVTLAPRTDLFTAVRLHDRIGTDGIENLIKKGAELYPMLLHDVVNRIDDCESIINEILKRKPDLLNAQNKAGFTPFMSAVKNNRERAMKHLLAQDQLDLMKKDKNALATALSWAVYFNRPTDIIISILDKDPQLLNERSGGEKSLLHDAIGMHRKGNESDGYRLNRAAIINELLRRKPDLLYLKNREGRTPLQYAQELSILSESDKATICARLETAEKSLPQSSSITIDGQLQDTTSERGKKLAVGLIGVSLAIGIGYVIKKMIKSNNKPTEDGDREKGYVRGD